MSFLFKEFINESKGFMLTPSEYTKVAELTKKFIKLIENIDTTKTKVLPKHFFKDLKIIKNVQIKPRFIELSGISLYDRKAQKEKTVDVIVVLNYPDPPYDGLYRDSTEEIILFYDTLSKQSYYKIFEVISHEIIHAVQHYKDVSDEYEDALKQGIDKNELTKKAYYTEPVEFEATLGGIISKLEAAFQGFIDYINKYKEQKDHISVTFFKQKTLLFLKSLELFTKQPPDVYFRYKELDIPAPLQDKKDFFQTVSQLPYYKRKYQKALLNLLQTLQFKAEEI